jgi:hypothetical protein
MSYCYTKKQGRTPAKDNSTWAEAEVLDLRRCHMLEKSNSEVRLGGSLQHLIFQILFSMYKRTPPNTKTPHFLFHIPCSVVPVPTHAPTHAATRCRLYPLSLRPESKQRP